MHYSGNLLCASGLTDFSPFYALKPQDLPSSCLTFKVRLLAVVWVQGEHRGGKGGFDRGPVRGQTKERSHGAGP